MQKGLLLRVIILLVVLGAVPLAWAQPYFKFNNLQNQANPGATAQLEVEGILKMFGSLVGSGLYHTADMHAPLGLDVGLRGAIISVPDEFGSLPVFIDSDHIGLAFLHGSLGLASNIELFGRFFYMPLGASTDPTGLAPANAADSRGGVTLIGGGAKYGLLQQMGLPKIMVMGTYHALLVPEEYDFATVNCFSFNVVASHSLLILSIYAGVGLDISSLKVNDDLPLPLPIAGKRFTEENFRYTIGAKANVFPLVHVNGALNFGKFSSFNLGMGISFR